MQKEIVALTLNLPPYDIIIALWSSPIVFSGKDVEPAQYTWVASRPSCCVNVLTRLFSYNICSDKDIDIPEETIHTGSQLMTAHTLLLAHHPGFGGPKTAYHMIDISI